jgi:cell fate regulator YaaT (PSP1 superfamily)
MPRVVGIRFKPATKIYYFDPQEHDLKAGSFVVVETTRGKEIGRVVIPPTEVPPDEVVGQLKPIERVATAWDTMQMKQHQEQEANLLRQCRAKVAETQLSMKVVHAEQSFDGTRITFYFTSEQRIDFRQLVKDLAKTFKARIELRQVGVRDDAKLLGGVGMCGRSLCCSTFLAEFHQVAIKMAKQQDLPLSPNEISGVCGRLLCCLAYEYDTYVELRKNLPKRNEIVQTPDGQAKVIEVHPLREKIVVIFEDGTTKEMPASELTSGHRGSLEDIGEELPDEEENGEED